MILSHARRFVFIKAQKTAGTSIEVALSRFCGASDIVTPITPEDESLREMRPQNYMRGEAERKSRPDGLPAPNEGVDFYNHMPLAKVAGYVGRDTIDGLFKFTAIRNPWERCVSWYLWAYATGQAHRAFGDWLVANAGRLSIAKMLSLDGKMAVDFVIRFERLEQDWAAACERIGIPAVPLPHAKRTAACDWRAHYDERTRAKVARACAEDIAAFGYEF